VVSRVFFVFFRKNDRLGLGTHLFVKVTRPGDSEVTFSAFESSCHLSLLCNLAVQRLQ